MLCVVAMVMAVVMSFRNNIGRTTRAVSKNVDQHRCPATQHRKHPYAARPILFLFTQSMHMTSHTTHTALHRVVRQDLKSVLNAKLHCVVDYTSASGNPQDIAPVRRLVGIDIYV